VHVVGGHSRSGFAQVVHGIDHTANPVRWMLMILFSNDETNKQILPLISVFFVTLLQLWAGRAAPSFDACSPKLSLYNDAVPISPLQRN